MDGEVELDTFACERSLGDQHAGVVYQGVHHVGVPGDIVGDGFDALAGRDVAGDERGLLSAGGDLGQQRTPAVDVAADDDQPVAVRSEPPGCGPTDTGGASDEDYDAARGGPRDCQLAVFSFERPVTLRCGTAC